MLLGVPGKPREKLGVGRMALALVLAAFLGAALGLVWQSASFFDGDDQDVADTKDASADDSAPVGPTVPTSG